MPSPSGPSYYASLAFCGSGSFYHQRLRGNRFCRLNRGLAATVGMNVKTMLARRQRFKVWVNLPPSVSSMTTKADRPSYACAVTAVHLYFRWRVLRTSAHRPTASPSLNFNRFIKPVTCGRLLSANHWRKHERKSQRAGDYGTSCNPVPPCGSGTTC